METEPSMHSIQLKSYVGSDGLLHIPLPDLQNTEVDFILVYQPVKATQKRQWSSEFVSVFSSWQGEPLGRAPQEEASERESL